MGIFIQAFLFFNYKNFLRKGKGNIEKIKKERDTKKIEKLAGTERQKKEKIEKKRKIEGERKQNNIKKRKRREKRKKKSEFFKKSRFYIFHYCDNNKG